MKLGEMTGPHPRIGRRRAAVARSKKRRTFLWASLALGLGAAVWAAFFSPLLAVRDVRIVGARHTPRGAVVRAALGAGDNILSMAPAHVAEKVSRLPWVKHVRVDRMLPGTVRVEIKERSPAALVTEGSRSYTVDVRGHVLARGATNKGLPLIAQGATPGDRVGARLSQPGARAALAIYRSMPPRLSGRVVALIAPTPERVTVSLDDGTLIRYGAAYRLAAKHKVVGALFRRLSQEGRSPGYIDVRVPTSPAVGG
jgi:cell division protein FtsQ